MKVLLFVAALLGAAAFASASEDPKQKLPGVLDLDPDSFPKSVNGAKHALVEFYAPWCGHCKHLVPEYKKLGELVQADPALKNRVVIAKVDADQHRSVGEKFEVRGFPTIKFFKRGKPVDKSNAQDYNGARTAQAFLDYLKKEVQADAGFARVEALDPIAKKFADAADKAAVIAEAKAAAAKLEGDAKANAELYVKLMEKAVEKGVAYLAKEKARVEKLLGSGSVASAKAEELSKKSSVLGAFAAEDAE